MARVVVWCAARGIPLYGPSGSSAHLRGIARALVARGDEVLVATPLDSDDRGRHDDLPPIPAIHGARRWPDGLRTFGDRLDGHTRARRALPGASLIWERHEPRSAAAARWARLLRIPRFVELDAPLSLERRWPRAPRPAELARERALLRRADRVIAVSAWLAQWAVAQGCAPDRVRHVPNGVASGAPGRRDATRARLGLGGPVLGFVGSMSPWQGADRIPALLDALGPPWTAVVVGSGPAPPLPHPRLLQLGRVPEDALPDLVSAFDVGIAPYVASAPPWFCPLKILAYRAQGVPVVASDLGDCRALVADAGEIVATDDARVWATAIRTALGRPRIARVRTWDDVVRESLSAR